MSAVVSENGPVTAHDNLNFYQSIGRQTIESESCWWYNAYGQKTFYFAFPPQRLISPGRAEVARLFAQLPVFSALRFLSPAGSRQANSYRWVRRGPYRIDDLSANSRSKIRRGLRNCAICPVSFEELATHGQLAQHDTMLRQGKPARDYQAGKLDHPGHAYAAWGAWIDDDLAAFVITQRIDDWVHIQVNRSVNRHLRHYPNNALIYEVTSRLLGTPGITTVSYGWESLTPLESLDQFKLSMGFEQEAARQVILLSPRLRWAWNPFTRLLGRLVSLALPTNRLVKQFRGLSRFITTRV
ncbi:MAG: hypothetical protein ACK5RR_07755 [Acidobacteriota bacterium]